MALIKSDVELQEFLSAAGSARYLALDTEFVRERTYYPTLCLVQLGIDDSAVCVDCIEGIEPKDLSVLMSWAPAMLVHSGRQDLEILWYATGMLPGALVDTQIAAALTGLPSQVGYADLAQRILGIDLDKSQTRRDWTKRPLPESALRYALDDVAYLEPLLDELLTRLDKLGRLEWLEEDCQAQLNPQHFEDLDRITKRLRGISRLTKPQQDTAAKLVEWREDRAKDANRPRRWILADDVLIDMAKAMPTSVDDLMEIDRLPEKLVERNGEKILHALENGESTAPDFPAPSSREQRNLQKRLQERVSDLCKQLRLDPEVVATRQELGGLARGELPSRLASGWRNEYLSQAGIL